LDDQVVYQADRVETGKNASPAVVIPQIVALVDELRGKFPEIKSVGIGVPGFVDFETGFIYVLPNMKGWENFSMREELAKSIDLPIAIENDANAMAYAEWKRGAGRGMQHMLAVTLGTGVGGGLILNGQMHRGAKCIAAEIGHTSIDYEGRTGNFGNRGGLEKYIGHTFIYEESVKMFQEAGRKPFKNIVDLAIAAQEGDELALAVWDGVAKKLSSALMSVCFLLNVEGIIIGGGVARAGAILFDPLKKYLKEQLMPALWDDLKIQPARYGNEAGTIGAAVLGLELAGLSD